MTAREANLVKQTRRCLKCGRMMWTDRCHRICVKCGHENDGLLEDKASVGDDVRHWLRTFVRNEQTWPSAGLPTLAPALQED